MTEKELVERVAERAALDEERARRVISRVLRHVAEQLAYPDAVALADELPPKVGEVLRARWPFHRIDAAQLYDELAREENVGVGFAVEHAKVVGAVICRALRPEVLQRLRRDLHPSVAALFTPSEAAAPFEHVQLNPSRGTIAEGTGGSRHPLFMSRPERAHSQSVVRSDNPHADVKLSSSVGLTQEREKETLADGRPSRR